MIEEFIASNLSGLGLAGTFIVYLMYQTKLNREDRKEEMHLRIQEKNQFITILTEIKEELIQLRCKK